jgi:hypothetical protein
MLFRMFDRPPTLLDELFLRVAAASTLIKTVKRRLNDRRQRANKQAITAQIKRAAHENHLPPAERARHCTAILARHGVGG